MPDQDTIKKFSKHLFWDVNRDNMTLEKSKKLIVQRVLEYGLLDDWILLKNTYGIESIAETAVTLRSLEPRALAFISNLSGIPIEKFRCYEFRLLNKIHWDF